MGGTFAYTLYTHCGIDYANINGAWFEADKPLTDGNGSPPKGWGDPTQAGRMNLLSASTAEFRDDRGHDVTFHALTATQRPRTCS